MEATIIVFSNLKGGVGKTTTTNAFAASLVRRGYKVLCIDMDPQGNLSRSVNALVDENTPTILEVMKLSSTASEAVQHLKPFDIIPSDIMLSGYELELLGSKFGTYKKLSRAIAPLKSEYDYILIDTAPSLGLLTINALVAADEVIAPSAAECFSVSGIELLVDAIHNVRMELENSKLNLDGILMTQMDPRTRNARAVTSATEQFLEYIAQPSKNEYGEEVTPVNSKIYKTYIRKSVAMGESQTNQEDIFTYSPNSTVAKDYKSFTDEYLTSHGKELKVNA